MANPMEQQLLNSLKKENDELKERIVRLEDEADYWKQEFERFYNAIYRSIKDFDELIDNHEHIN